MTTTDAIPADVEELANAYAFRRNPWAPIREIIAEAIMADRSSRAPGAEAGRWLSSDDVEWVVNDIAELGVKIGDQFFFLYKGGSLVYGELDDDPTIAPTHDDGSPMHWRPVFKREFGECAHPINYDDPNRVGKVSLTDSDKWQQLPAAAPSTHPAPSSPDAEMVDEVRRLRESNALLDRLQTQRVIMLNDIQGVAVGGRNDGWLVWKHSDGQWVTKEKLKIDDNPTRAILTKHGGQS